MNYLNKRTIIFISMICLLAFVAVGCNKATKGTMGKEVVVEVNGEKMPMEQFKNQVDYFIEKRSVMDDASKKNISVTDEEINEVVKAYEQQYGGKENMEKMLEKNNVTMDYFKDDVKYMLIFQKHAEDFMKNEKVSEEEAKKYFEENKDEFVSVKASHILVETEKEGKKILEELNKGKDFASIASKESIDEASRQAGGDLGYFKKGSMVKEFEDAAFSLKKGETSDLVKTQHGFHIIKVDDRKDKYEDVKDEVMESVKNAKYGEYVDKLKDNANVKIYLKENKKSK